MSTFTLFSNHYSSSTTISNHFIDYYMADANDAQLKVYLYLLRSLGICTNFSISDIADKFNHTEADVLRSLKYWETKGLLSIDMNSTGQITGIHLRSSEITSSEVTSSENAISPASQPLPISSSATPLPSKEPEEDMDETPLFIKPSYSLDQIKAFKNDNSCAQLLFIAEAYLGKTLSANDVRSILFISDVLQFSDDLIDFLLQYCVERGKKDFRYIEKVALNWAESKITTPEQAASFSSKYDKSVYTVMNALGKSSSPTAKEVDYIKRWNGDYAFTIDIIIEACERTVLATDKHRFEYADKILSSWKKAGVHHKADISKMDASYHKNKATQATPKATISNKFNQFQQNDYDFDAIEQRLLMK
ncbi:MAG: DnaD domain protein [Eubacteriales bacterium]